MFYTLILQSYSKNGQKKEIPSWGRKEIRRKTNQCYHNDILDKKGTAFPVNLKLQGESLE